MKKWILIVAGLAWLAQGQARAQKKVDFAKDIQPILQQSCIRCHGADKQKGKLRLDSKEAAFKGGKDGPVIVSGNAEKSEVHRRIALPKGDDDVMPNEGEPLTKAQIELIRDWINQGAVWPEGVVLKESGSSSPVGGLPADFKPGANEAKAIAKFTPLGVEIRPIAMNVVWREANFRPQSTNITDAVLAPLKEVTSLVDLNLAGTKITDAGLTTVAGLTNLTHLHLEQTQITDAGLAHLKGLTNLNYLNLYGTPVTDAGLQHLKGLRNLKHLYVWQTKVTGGGVTNLQQALPNLDISTGWDLNALAKTPEKTEEKKTEEKK